MPPFLLEIGLLATLGFGANPQRMQDIQRPYFLLEKKLAEKYTARLYVESRVYDWQTKENLAQFELTTREPGFNYAVGLQSENEMGNWKTKTGEVVYLKVFYRFGDQP